MNGYLSAPGNQRVPVVDGLTIGRVKDCDVLLEDPKASRHHARLIVASSVVEIEDLGSSNGTMVNGKPVRRRMLRSGDVIQIGTSLITYREDEDAKQRARSEPPAAPQQEVIEFLDERVEVRSAPMRVRRRKAAAPALRSGVLRDDLRQMGGFQRLVLVVVVVVVAAAMGYLAYRIAGRS